MGLYLQACPCDFIACLPHGLDEIGKRPRSYSAYCAFIQAAKHGSVARLHVAIWPAQATSRAI